MRSETGNSPAEGGEFAVVDERDSAIAAGALIGFGVMPPVFARALTPTEALLGAIQLAGAWAVGVILSRHVPSLQRMIPVVRSGVALIVGSILFYPISTAQSVGVGSQWLMLGLAIGALIVVHRRRMVGVERVGTPDWLLLVVAAGVTVVSSLANGDVGRSLLRYPDVLLIADDVDAPYFTSIVATLRKGVHLSAIYERGTPLSYSVVAGWPPAAFAVASQAPSHVALWGVWMPLFKVIGALLIAECVRRLVGIRRATSLTASVAVLLFFLLQPLHPQYVLAGEIDGFVWGGGFLWGGQNLPTSAGIVWATLALAITLPHSREANMHRTEMGLVAAVLGVLCATKVTLFLATCVVLSVAGALRLRRSDRSLVMTLAITLPVALIAYRWAYGGGTRRPEFSLGYLPKHFAGLAGISPESPGVLVKGLTIAAGVYFVWSGVRVLGGALLVWLRDDGLLVSARRGTALGSLAALGVGLFVATVLAIPRRDEGGIIIGDESFNLMQFPRAAFLFISIVGVSGILAYFASVPRSRRKRMALILTVGTWSVLALTGLSMHAGSMPRATRDEWLTEARAEMVSLRPQLAAIDPTDTRSLYLAASDVGWFWVSQTHFVTNSRHSERWAAFSAVFSGTFAARSEACRVMRRDGVDAVVALPAQVAAIERFGRECGFERPSGQRWVWLRSAR